MNPIGPAPILIAIALAVLAFIVEHIIWARAGYPDETNFPQGRSRQTKTKKIMAKYLDPRVIAELQKGPPKESRPRAVTSPKIHGGWTR